MTSNDSETVRRLKADADRGDAEAQYHLGRFYLLGRLGLPKDHQEAARLYKLAAQGGNADAQYELGISYMGHGYFCELPRDNRAAYRLLVFAARQGHDGARQSLETHAPRGAVAKWLYTHGWYRSM